MSSSAIDMDFSSTDYNYHHNHDDNHNYSINHHEPTINNIDDNLKHNLHHHNHHMHEPEHVHHDHNYEHEHEHHHHTAYSHGHGHSHGHDNDGHDHNHEADLSDHDVSHFHFPDEKTKKSRRSEKVLWLVAILSAIFIAAEFTGGYFASSLAIMTDAGHMLSDLLSFIISIIAIRTARHPATKKLSFGYDRAEVLGALISIVILWVLTAILVMLAIQRIIDKDYDVDPMFMLITASAGVGFNIIMAIVLFVGKAGHAHSHGGGSHGHSHGNGDETNVNVRAAFIHVLGDLIQSIGVLISALIIKYTNWQIADPICTFVFSIIVLFTTLHVLRDIFYVLMEASPRHMDYNMIKQDLSGIEGVLSVHDLRMWSLNMDKTALSVHLAIENSEKALSIVSGARDLVRRKHGISLSTVQVEEFDKTMDSCDKCIH